MLVEFCIFVSRNMQKTIQLIFTKFCGNVPHGPRKKTLDFDGNPDHFTLGGAPPDGTGPPFPGSAIPGAGHWGWG